MITPKAVEYDYKLMFEDRTISVLTYNKETLLAEKMQTIINRVYLCKVSEEKPWKRNP